MNENNLEQIWKKLTNDSFETFIKTHVGYKEDATRGTVPKCFGSGDDRPWCFNCPLARVC
jgi:hypothetical protein